MNQAVDLCVETLSNRKIIGEIHRKYFLIWQKYFIDLSEYAEKYSSCFYSYKKQGIYLYERNTVPKQSRRSDFPKYSVIC